MTIDTEAIRKGLDIIADALDAKAEPEPFRVTGPGVYRDGYDKDDLHVRPSGTPGMPWVDQHGCHYNDSGEYVYLLIGVLTKGHERGNLARRIGDLPSEERDRGDWFGPGEYLAEWPKGERQVCMWRNTEYTGDLRRIAPHFEWQDGGNPDTGAVCAWGEGKFAVKAMVWMHPQGKNWVAVVTGRALHRFETGHDEHAAARGWAERQMAAELKRRAVE